MLASCCLPQAVLLNPARRPELPFTAEGIRERLSEMSFTSALYAELQGIELAKQAAVRNPLPFGMLERRLKSRASRVFWRTDPPPRSAAC